MNTLRLIRWRGERHASITQRLNFAAHATPEATLALVYAHESGLEPDEVRQARRAYGGNTIPAPDVHESPARRLVRAFMNPFIGVLMLLALTSFVCSLAQRGIVTSGTTAANGGGTPVTVGIILLMAVVSGLIRYVHDSRSSHAATALATMVSTTATVRRAADSVRRACRGRHRDVVRRRHRPGRLQAAGEPRPAHRAGGRSLAKACPCARMLPHCSPPAPGTPR